MIGRYLSPRRAGFTLLELLVVLGVLAALSAVAVPTFDLVRQRTLQSTVDRTLAAVGRAGEAACLLDPDLPMSGIITEAVDGIGGDLVLGIGTDSVSISLSSGDRTATGSVEFTVCESTVAPSIVTDGAGTILFTGIGTFHYPAEALTIVRSATQTIVVDTTANWKHMQVVYDLGAGTTTDTVYKTTGPSTVGVVTRNSNTNVTIALPSDVEFRLVVKYAGQSTGTTYLLG